VANHVIIASLRALVELYKQLLQTSEKKTEAIKDYQLEPLQKLLVTERKLIQQTEKAEKKRHQAVESWFDANDFLTTDRTITMMLSKLKDEPFKQQLEQLSTRLLELITEFKKQEHLNQELLVQSLQFVHLSLNMMNPSMSHINYGKSKDSSLPKRSVFDSKA